MKNVVVNVIAICTLLMLMSNLNKTFDINDDYADWPNLYA